MVNNSSTKFEMELRSEVEIEAEMTGIIGESTAMSIMDSILQSSWRDEAMDQALQAEAQNGESVDALLQAIRKQMPGAATFLIWPDRLQLMRFLQNVEGGSRSMLPGETGLLDRKQVFPYLGWHSLTWENELIEIAIVPSTYVSGSCICIGTSMERLHKLSDAIDDVGLWPEGRCLKYSRNWTSAPEIDSEIGKVTWDDVIVEPEILNGVRDAVESFYGSKEVFQELGFPWKRGLLLIGPPGTGKTMLCKAAATAVPNMPFLYVRDFTSDPDNCRDDAITNIFKRARRLAPCLLAFEDIDGLVNDANRTLFLNELDGFESNEGLLIMASSNHPERIDEALLKRPSRFDRVYHVGLPALPQRREYCQRLMSAEPMCNKLRPDFDVAGLADRVANATNGFTPAYLKELFVTAGLSRAQAGATILDENFAVAVMEQVTIQKKQLRQLKTSESQAQTAGDVPDGIGIRRNR